MTDWVYVRGNRGGYYAVPRAHAEANGLKVLDREVRTDAYGAPLLAYKQPASWSVNSTSPEAEAAPAADASGTTTKEKQP